MVGNYGAAKDASVTMVAFSALPNGVGDTSESPFTRAKAIIQEAWREAYPPKEDSTEVTP